MSTENTVAGAEAETNRLSTSAQSLRSDVYAGSDSSLTDLDDKADLLQNSTKADLKRQKRRRIIIGCGIATVVLLVIILVVYFVVVPNMVRNIFAHENIYMYPDSVNLTMKSNNSIEVDFQGELYLTGLPMKAGFDPESYRIYTGDGTPLVTDAWIPEKYLYPSERTKMKFTTVVSMGELEQLAKLLAGLSEEKGVSGVLADIRVKSSLGLSFFGIKMYNGLEVERKISLEDISIPKILDAVLNNKTLPGGLGNIPADPTLKTQPRPEHPKFVMPEIRNIKMTTFEKGFTIDTEVMFTNTLPIAASVPNLSFLLTLDQKPLIKVRVRNLNLPPVNSPPTLMKPSIDILMLEDYTELGLALRNALFQYLDSGKIPIGVSGPIQWDAPIRFEAGKELTADIIIDGKKMESAPWMGKITSGLKVDIPVDALMKSETSDGQENQLNLLKDVKFKFNLTMDETKIMLPVQIQLPKAVNVPPVQLDYDIAVNVWGEAARLLGVSLGNVSLQAPPSQDLGNTAKAQIIVTPDNAPQASQDLANVVNGVLTTNKLSTLTLKDFRVNPSSSQVGKCEWCDKAFTGVEFPVPLKPIDLKQAIKNATAAPSSSSDKPSPLQDMKIGSLDIAQSNQFPGFTVSTNLNFPPIIPGSINVPFFSTNILVDNSTLVTLSLPKGVSITDSSSAQNVSIGLEIRVNQQDQNIADKVSTLVNRFMNDGSGVSLMGISGLLFGVSQEKAFKTFERVAVNVDTDAIKEVLRSQQSNSSLSIPAGLIKPMSADVAMTSANQLTISSSLQIQNPFPVSLTIGSVSVATLLNNQQFVSVVLPPINLRQGSNNLDLNNIQINLGTSNALPPAVANIVSGFLEKRDIADTLAITGLSISSPSNVEAAKIVAFSKVSVPVNLNSLRQGLESPSAGSLIDTSVILPSPLTIPTPRLLNASVDTQPQATIALSASLSYTNPLPVSIRIPYISLDGSVNGGRLVSVSISGLDIQRGGGSKQLGLRVNLRFNNEERAKNDVASIVSRVMNNQALDGVSVGVAQVILGTSAEAVTQLLSQVRVNLDAQPLMEKLKSAGGGGEGLLPPIDTKSLDPKLGNLKIVTQPDKQLSVSLSAAITNPLPISLNIGYLSATVNVNGAPIFAAALSNIRLGQARNNMELSLSLRFFDGQPSQDAVANLVREIMSSSQWQSTIGIGSPIVGASASDAIRTFSKVEVNMPLTNFVVPGNLRSLSLPSLGGAGGQSPVSLKSGDIKVLPGSRIQIAASLGLNIDVPVTVDIGYVSLSALISDVPAVDITLNGLKVAPGTKDLNLNLDIRIRDEPGLSDKLSALFDAVLNKKEITEVLGISSIAFGSSANDKDRIDTLRKANIAIPLTNFDTNGLALPTLGGGSSASFKDFNVNFKTGDVVDLSLTANLGFSFPLSVDVGYLSVTAQLDDTKVVSVRLNGLKITPQTKDLSLALSLQFYDSAALEDKIAALVRSVLRKEPAAGNLVLSGLQIGVSPQDYIRALEKASVPIQLQKLVGGLQVPTIGPISGGNATIPFDIKELKAVFAANDRIEFGVKTGLKIAFPASVNVGFIAVALQVDNVPALSVHVKQLALSPTTKELSIQIAVQVEDSPQLADKLAVLFDDLLRKKFDHTVTITGIRAGVSQDDHISALSKVAYPLNLQQLFNPNGNQESTLSLPMPSSNFVSDLVQKVGLNVSEADIQTLPDRRISATVRASFSNPFPIDVQLGYASVMIGVDNTDVVSLNLGGLRMGQGSNSLTLTVGAQLSNGDANAQTLGKFVTDLLSGTIGEHTVMIKSLILGPSREDSIMALSKSNVNLPVKMILTPEKLKELLDKLPKLVPQPGAGGLPAGIGLTGGNIDITKGGKISIPLRGSVPKNLPVKMSIGFVALNVALDRITFVRIGIRDLQVVPAEGRFALTLDIGLSNVGSIPGKIAEIIKALITKGQLPDMEVGLTNLLLGSSVEDHSNIFSRIFVPLRLRALIPGGGPNLPKIKIPEPDVIQINVEEDPTDAEAFILKIPITFKQPVSPIGLSLGYAHVKVSIDKVDALDIDLREFSLQENSQKLDLNIRGKGLSEEGIALLGKIIENQGQGINANLLLSDVFFGASKTDNFDILSAVQLPLTLGNSTGTPMELPPVTVGGKPLNELMKSVSIGQVLGNVNHDGLKAMVDVNARLPINVVGIHGLDAQIFFKNQPIFAIEARNLKVVANQNPHVDALLKPVFPAATDAFAEIYELIKANKSVADISAGGIVIHSSKGSSRMFSKLRLNIPPSHVEDPKIIGGPDFGRMFTQFQVGTKVRCIVPVTFPTDINLGNVRFEVESNMRKSSFTQDREYGLMGVVDDQDVHLTDKIQGFHAFIKNKIINPLKLVAAMQDINTELKYLKNIRTYVDGRQVTWLSTMLAKTNVRVVVELKLRGV